MYNIIRVTYFPTNVFAYFLYLRFVSRIFKNMFAFKSIKFPTGRIGHWLMSHDSCACS